MAHTLIMCVWQAFCCCCCLGAMPSILHFPHVSCHWIIIFLRHSLSFVGTIFIASICFPGHLSSHHLWLMSRGLWTIVWIATFLQIHLTDTHMTRDSLRCSRGNNNIICNCEKDNLPILRLPLSKAVASFSSSDYTPQTVVVVTIRIHVEIEKFRMISYSVQRTLLLLW